MHVTSAARFLIVTLSLVLLIPVVGIALQNPAALEVFHNRTLAKWPEKNVFAEDPTQYFLQVRKWLGDRGYPIIAATHLYKVIKLYALKTPPERRLTLGPNGLIFLNGISEGNINGIFETVCILAHHPEKVARFTGSFEAIADYSRRTKIPIDVIIFPTKETLYGDYLPLSVPEKYREACRTPNADSPLINAQRLSNPLVLYPSKEMTKARDDPAFFPKGNWPRARF